MNYSLLFSLIILNSLLIWHMIKLNISKKDKCILCGTICFAIIITVILFVYHENRIAKFNGNDIIFLVYWILFSIGITITGDLMIIHYYKTVGLSKEEQKWSKVGIFTVLFTIFLGALITGAFPNMMNKMQENNHFHDNLYANISYKLNPTVGNSSSATIFINISNKFDTSQGEVIISITYEPYVTIEADPKKISPNTLFLEEDITITFTSNETKNDASMRIREIQGDKTTILKFNVSWDTNKDEPSLPYKLLDIIVNKKKIKIYVDKKNFRFGGKNYA